MASRTSRTATTSATGTGRGKTTTTGQQKEAATKGTVRDELLRKKDELIKLKSLDIFLIKDALGINPKKSDMKSELREIVKRLKKKILNN
ncbi:hypothetical protein [Microcoleus sp. B4-C1]|uniref:hypothetical protein n=1 Tax=Microcoleus sp. B4-C1 TaxID=2818660 RepID=UPI002FD10E42